MIQICECVAPTAVPLLKSILDMFTAEWSGRPDSVYLDSTKFKEVHAQVGDAQLELILALLDEAGIVGHSGSLVSSSYLTVEGLKLRESLEEK